MGLVCVFLMGVESHESHAASQSTSSSTGKPVLFQSRNILPSLSNAGYDDVALSRHLLDIESRQDQSQSLFQTEFIRLSTIQSPHIPRTRFARRIHVQQPSERALTVADLYFDSDRVRLGHDLIDVLHTSVDALPAGRERRVYLEAYCDERGGMAYSLALAARRMELVKIYFLDLGVPPHKLQTVNYGPLRPACEESTGRCQESNVKIQSTFKFFAILEPQFGCLTRIKVAYPSNRSTRSNLARQSIVHRQIRLAPLSIHR